MLFGRNVGMANSMAHSGKLDVRNVFSCDLFYKLLACCLH
jgi:hypothetical protein